MIRNVTPDTEDVLPEEIVSVSTGIPDAELPAEPTEHVNLFADALMGVPRGIEDFGQSVWSLADFLTGDSLPDWDKGQFFGKSQSTIGSVVENTASFLTGFIPGVGLAGKVGKLAGLGGKALSIASNVGGGAIADFLSRDGHEERLSNLIQKHPELANPVADFLAASEDDGEIEGRFKNALEGLGLGAVTGGLGAALKNLKLLRNLEKARGVGDAVAEASLKQKALNAAVEAGTAAERDLTTLASTKPVVEAASTTAPEVLSKPSESGFFKRLFDYDPTRAEGGNLFQYPEKELPEYLSLMRHGMGNVLKDMVDHNIANLPPTRSVAFSETLKQAEQVMQEVLPGGLAQANAWARQWVGAAADAGVAQVAHFKLVQGAMEAKTILAKAISEGRPVAGMSIPDMLANYAELQRHVGEGYAIAKGFGTEFARGLNVRKALKDAGFGDDQVTEAILEQHGGASFLKAEVRKEAIVLANPDPVERMAGMLKLAGNNTPIGARLLRAHNELWLNSVLSGTKTSIINGLGNSIATFMDPLEKAAGSLVAGDMRGAKAGFKNLLYLTEQFKDLWSFTMKAGQVGPKDNLFGAVASALKNDEGLLMNGAKGFNENAPGAVKAISAEALGVEQPMLARLTDTIGKAVNLPSRILMGGDELFKQLGYRAAAKTELYYRGLNKGLSGDALQRFVADGFEQTITKGGRMFSEGALLREAVDAAKAEGIPQAQAAGFIKDYVKTRYDAAKSALKEDFDVMSYAKATAEENTFSEALGPMGSPLQTLAASHPLFQLFVPFVKTPMNLAKWYARRGASGMVFVPGLENLQARNLADVASTNGLVRNKALGRIAMGQMLAAGAGLAAFEGRITGAGPSDPNERALLMQTGWQPYSIKVNSAEGPVYVSYQRLDPIATFLGTMADWTSVATRMEQQHADKMDAVLKGVWTSLSNNVTNKTYLASLAQVIDAVSQPDRKFEQWSRARVASYVPSVLAQFSSATDDGQTMKAVRGYMDAVLNRIPGAAGGIESKRNVLGEVVDARLHETPWSPVNPFTVTRDKNDKLANELALLNHGLQPPSNILSNRLDLLHDAFRMPSGQSAYDRWQQLAGEVRVGGLTLRQRLEKLVNSAAYQKLPNGPESGGLDSPRLSEVRRAISQYRNAALRELQKENPKVKAALQAVLQDSLAIRRGKAASQLEALLK